MQQDVSENIPQIKGYFNKLVSVFSDLIINAYQAMTKAELTNRDKRILGIKAEVSSERSEWVEISIANRGEPVPENELKKIFKEGYSTKDSMGVGLDICKTQVEVFHRGKIFVRNLKGFGPEFAVHLSVWQEMK